MHKYKLMCFDRNINGNRDVKFLEWEYWSLHWWKNLTLAKVILYQSCGDLSLLVQFAIAPSVLNYNLQNNYKRSTRKLWTLFCPTSPNLRLFFIIRAYYRTLIESLWSQLDSKLIIWVNVSVNVIDRLSHRKKNLTSHHNIGMFFFCFCKPRVVSCKD